MNVKTILLNVRVQEIYYQTDDNQLGIKYATSEKRITIDEAEEILIQREIKFKDVLKVKYEYIQLEVPMEDLENYII